MIIRNSLHLNLCEKNNSLHEWYCKKKKGLAYPLYSSYDIRDSGFKISNVDANIFPAGFNNICPQDKKSSSDLFRHYLHRHYGQDLERLMIVTEEHSNNPYYWENVSTIKTLLEEKHFKVLLGLPRKFDQILEVKNHSGTTLNLVSAFEDNPLVKEFAPQLIISNNDFSLPYEDWAAHLSLPMNPPRELGWYQRKKSLYFHFYNTLVEDFCSHLGLDPFSMNVKTDLLEGFDIKNDQSRKELAIKVEAMLIDIRLEYEKRDIDQKPVVFVKNNSGTYGLGVVAVQSASDVLDWSYKTRKKMKAAKGGRDVEEVIIQEGIPTEIQTEEGATAEPVIYMVGSDLAGGFLRTHSEKNSTESLNSPGAVYKKLCVTDLVKAHKTHPLENVYGWTAKLGLLAIAQEAQALNATFIGFKPDECLCENK